MKKMLQKLLKSCLLLLVVGAFSYQGISAQVADNQDSNELVSGMPAVKQHERPSLEGSQSNASASQPVAKLEQDLSNLLLKRVQDFVKPLVTALKPATMDLLAVTSKEVMKTLLANQSVIDPEVLGILQEPVKQLVSLTKGATGMLAGMPAISVDDWFNKLDGLKDELIGHLKVADLVPGSNAHAAITKILGSVTSLENVMKIFQGDVASELKKRIEDIKKPISAAANQLLAGLPPETVERILIPLKALQGDIAQSLKAELDSFKKVILAKLPQSLLQEIKLKAKLLVEKIQENPSILPSNVRRLGELLAERVEILSNPIAKIPREAVKAIKNDLAMISRSVTGKNEPEVKATVASLEDKLDDVDQIVSSDRSIDASQVAVQASTPDQSATPIKKGFLSELISRVENFVEKDIPNASREVVDSITGGKVPDPKPGEKVSALFSDLSDGTIIVIRSASNSPGQGRYLSVVDEYLKPAGASKTETAAQFIVARFNNFLGLKSKMTGKFLICDPSTLEIKCSGKDFYSETADAAQFIPVGNRIDKMWLKNKKTGAYLNVRKPNESWSHGGSVMARDGDGKPAKATNWGRLAIDIVFQPNEPLAQASQSLDLLPSGVLVAIKSLKNPSNPKYLAVDLSATKDKFFVRASGTSKDDPACQFYVVRKDNWLGFKTHGWRSLCAEPLTHKVKFIERSDTLASSIEHWELHPEKDGSLKNVWLQSRSSQGYLTVPTGDWTNNLVWTGFAQTKNPLAGHVKGVSKFIMQPAGQGDNGRFEIEIVKAIPEDVGGGGSTFTFLPAYHGKNEVKFHQSWKFPAGDLELILKDIDAQDNAYINLSPVKGKSSESLRILLGRENNTSSSIRLGDSELFNAKDASGGVIKSPAAFWVRLKDGELSVGKGVEFGVNPIGQVKIDKKIAANIAYLGLGGSIEPVFYRSISMNNVEEEKPVVVVPAIQEPVVVVPALQEPIIIEDDQEEPIVEEPIIPVVPVMPVVPGKAVSEKVIKRARAKKPSKKKRKKPAKKKKSAKKKKPAKKKKKAAHKKKTSRPAKPQEDGHHRMQIQAAQFVSGDKKTAAREKRNLKRAKRRKQREEREKQLTE